MTSPSHHERALRQRCGELSDEADYLRAQLEMATAEASALRAENNELNVGLERVWSRISGSASTPMPTAEFNVDEHAAEVKRLCETLTVIDGALANAITSELRALLSQVRIVATTFDQATLMQDVANTRTAQAHSQLLKRNEVIKQLTAQLTRKDAQIADLQARLARAPAEAQSRGLMDSLRSKPSPSSTLLSPRVGSLMSSPRVSALPTTAASLAASLASPRGASGALLSPQRLSQHPPILGDRSADLLVLEGVKHLLISKDAELRTKSALLQQKDSELTELRALVDRLSAQPVPEVVVTQRIAPRAKPATSEAVTSPAPPQALVRQQQIAALQQQQQQQQQQTSQSSTPVPSQPLQQSPQLSAAARPTTSPVIPRLNLRALQTSPGSTPQPVATAAQPTTVTATTSSPQPRAAQLPPPRQKSQSFSLAAQQAQALRDAHEQRTAALQRQRSLTQAYTPDNRFSSDVPSPSASLPPRPTVPPISLPKFVPDSDPDDTMGGMISPRRAREPHTGESVTSPRLTPDSLLSPTSFSSRSSSVGAGDVLMSPRLSRSSSILSPPRQRDSSITAEALMSPRRYIPDGIKSPRGSAVQTLSRTSPASMSGSDSVLMSPRGGTQTADSMLSPRYAPPPLPTLMTSPRGGAFTESALLSPRSSSGAVTSPRAVAISEGIVSPRGVIPASDVASTGGMLSPRQSLHDSPSSDSLSSSRRVPLTVLAANPTDSPISAKEAFKPIADVQHLEPSPNVFEEYVEPSDTIQRSVQQQQQQHPQVKSAVAASTTSSAVVTESEDDGLNDEDYAAQFYTGSQTPPRDGSVLADAVIQQTLLAQKSHSDGDDVEIATTTTTRPVETKGNTTTLPDARAVTIGSEQPSPQVDSDKSFEIDMADMDDMLEPVSLSDDSDDDNDAEAVQDVVVDLDGHGDEPFVEHSQARRESYSTLI